MLDTPRHVMEHIHSNRPKQASVDKSKAVESKKQDVAVLVRQWFSGEREAVYRALYGCPATAMLFALRVHQALPDTQREAFIAWIQDREGLCA